MKSAAATGPQLVALLLLLLLSLLFISCRESDVSSNKHVLVIGIDGVRPDALQVATTPNIDQLIANGAVTYDACAGGGLNTPTQQETVSGPGWSSIFTGVWADKHNVPTNQFAEPNYDEYPHFFARLKEARPKAVLASIAAWLPIQSQILSNEDYRFDGIGEDKPELDRSVTANAIEYVSTQDPDVVVFQLGNTDAAGHEYAFSPDSAGYVKAIETADEQVGAVVDAMRSRPNYAQEDWLVIVTTDHGGTGTIHGGQSLVERTVFIIVSGEGTRNGVIAPGPGHVAIPPTVFSHLEIEVDPGWGWESGPFGLAGEPMAAPCPTAPPLPPAISIELGEVIGPLSGVPTRVGGTFALAEQADGTFQATVTATGIDRTIEGLGVFAAAVHRSYPCEIRSIFGQVARGIGAALTAGVPTEATLVWIPQIDEAQAAIPGITSLTLPGLEELGSSVTVEAVSIVEVTAVEPDIVFEIVACALWPGGPAGTIPLQAPQTSAVSLAGLEAELTAIGVAEEIIDALIPGRR